MVRSLFKKASTASEDNSRQFADELIVLADALKAGLSFSSPIRAILSTLMDLLILAKNILQVNKEDPIWTDRKNPKITFGEDVAFDKSFKLTKESMNPKRVSNLSPKSRRKHLNSEGDEMFNFAIYDQKRADVDSLGNPPSRMEPERDEFNPITGELEAFPGDEPNVNSRDITVLTNSMQDFAELLSQVIQGNVEPLRTLYTRRFRSKKNQSEVSVKTHLKVEKPPLKQAELHYFRRHRRIGGTLK